MSSSSDPSGDHPRSPVPSDQPASPPDTRASDAEREQVIQELSEQMTNGRLTLAELEERVEKAFQATTHGQLAVLTTDLPDVRTTAPERRRKSTRQVISLMGGASKRGRWRVAERMTSLVLMGGNDLDLRCAALDSDDTTIVLVTVMGGTDIYVPDGIDLDVGGLSLLGGTDERGSERAPRPGAPRIRIHAYNLMGGTDVWRVPMEAWNLSLKEARRIAKRAT